MRVAVIDMGTNSTRLLVAEIDAGEVRELERRSTVTRLGRGVDTSGVLATEAIDDVCDTIAEYIEIYSKLGVERIEAIATSAVRDASNGAAFTAELRERFALDARVLTGEEEARLTYLGASHGREGNGETLVCDIGGGSTEIVVGTSQEIAFHASLQAGTVRHTERHIQHDPAQPGELEELASDFRSTLSSALGDKAMAGVERGIGVAGTPTSLAAIDQKLDPYDPERVHGYELTLPAVQRMCSELASKNLDQRLEVPGLHAGRAPTIVAGVIILIGVMRAFGLERIEVSERDILYGAALEAAGALA